MIDNSVGDGPSHKRGSFWTKLGSIGLESRKYFAARNVKAELYLTGGGTIQVTTLRRRTAQWFLVTLCCLGFRRHTHNMYMRVVKAIRCRAFR